MGRMALSDDRESDRMRVVDEDDDVPPTTVHGVNRPDHVTAEEPITLEEFKAMREAGVV